MANRITFGEAKTAYERLVTSQIPIATAIQEAVNLYYDMGRWPGTTRELTLADGDFVYDEDREAYVVTIDDTVYDGVLGFRNSGRGWNIRGQLSLYRDQLNSGDLDFIDLETVVVDGPNQVDAVAASLTLGTGDSAVVYTAVTPGEAGNLITVEQVAGVSTSDVEIGGGPFTPTLDTPLILSEIDEFDGRPDYTSNGLKHEDNYGVVEYTHLSYVGHIRWQLAKYNAAGDYIYRSLTDATTAMSPIGLTFGTPGYGEGVPTISGDDSTGIEVTSTAITITFNAYTANQVVAAVSGIPSALALITAAIGADGDGSGQVASVSGTLSGGTDAVVDQVFSHKFRCPMDFSLANGPYYALIKLDAPQLVNDTDIVPIPSTAALKALIMAVSYETANDPQRQQAAMQEFEQVMLRASRQIQGRRAMPLMTTTTMRRRPQQFP